MRQMMWPLNTVAIAKLAILATYLLPAAAIVEFVLSRRIIIAPIVGFFVVLYLWNLKGPDGEKIFRVENLEKRGVLYFFPMSLAERLGTENR
jgi:hypothetical protein